MAIQFFVGRGVKRFGPFSTAQLRELAVTDRLRPADTLWKEGIDGPVSISRVKNLIPLTQLTDASAAATETDASLPAACDLRPLDSVADVETKVTVEPNADVLAGDAGLAPLPDGPWTAPAAKEPPPAPKPEKVRMRRAIAIKGAIIIGQDGHSVQYRKKCTQCNHEDASRSSMLIGNGLTRIHFFCPKCRKSRDVQIQGMMQ